ncbi:hypothetical protein [Clostridium butyricum]|nr:hypothetical protein [Clostridium butyricum]
MKYKLDDIIKIKIRFSLKFNLSKLNILEIFLLLEAVLKLISLLS